MPKSIDEELALRRGARRIVFLFLLTIATAVAFENILRLPAVMGVMLGMAYLQFFGYFLKPSFGKDRRIASRRTAESSSERRANDR